MCSELQKCTLLSPLYFALLYYNRFCWTKLMANAQICKKIIWHSSKSIPVKSWKLTWKHSWLEMQSQHCFPLTRWRRSTPWKANNLNSAFQIFQLFLKRNEVSIDKHQKDKTLQFSTVFFLRKFVSFALDYMKTVYR